MTLQNRVDPFGEIVSHPARGTMMGNRGRLHDGARSLTRRRWTTRAWICCLLSFGGRQRQVMAPNRYTELFFLDEATALAAGHRPCYECRRADYHRFMAAWATGNGAEIETLRAGLVDDRLHAERLKPDKSKRTHEARLGTLPDGTMAVKLGNATKPFLIRGGTIHPWSPNGYGEGTLLNGDTPVTVLTPPSTIAALHAGFEPIVHPSIRA